MSRTLLIILGMLATALLAVSSAEASPTVKYEYRAYSSHHGVDAEIFEAVNVWATTTNPTVYKVVFTWKDPVENIIWVSEDATSELVNGEYRFDSEPHAPNTLGDWSVHVEFFSPDGKIQPPSEKIATRSTGFMVIPEVPVIGTAGMSATMLVCLAYVMRRNIRKGTAANDNVGTLEQ